MSYSDGPKEGVFPNFVMLCKNTLTRVYSCMPIQCIFFHSADNNKKILPIHLLTSDIYHYQSELGTKKCAKTVQVTEAAQI